MSFGMTTSFPQHRDCLHIVIPAEGGNPGRVTVHGETISEMGKSMEDKMDGARQSRVE
jgi:hypothetical protein